MTNTYWVEMALVVNGDACVVEKLAALLDERHDGAVVYTFSDETRRLNLGMSIACDDVIEDVPPRVVGTVRSVAHELGCHTPNWPEPVAISDVRIKILQASDTPVTA